MAESDFLVTLPSNSNMNTHPSNEPANYTVKLADPLQLDGEWEVALVSVQYTPTWLTFNKAIQIIAAYTENVHMPFDRPQKIYRKDAPQDLRQSYAVFQDLIDLLKDHSKSYNTVFEATRTNLALKLISLKPDYYESLEALGNEICRLLEQAFWNHGVEMRYTYDVNLKRGELWSKEGVMILCMERSAVLGDLLGHSTLPIDCNCTTPHDYILQLHGTKEPKLPRVSSLWVYTNITHYQQVGDSQVPLLGIIPAHRDGSKRMHYTVNPIHFLPINRNHISEINIQIVDDKGKRIPFVTGSTEDNLVCCLRFRRRKTPMPI